MKKFTIILALFCVIGLSAQDYVEFTNSQLTYTQDFDGLESTLGTKVWTNGTSPLLGWYAFKLVDTAPAAIVAYTTQSSAGLVSLGSSTTTSETDSTERALGAKIANAVGSLAYGVKIKNNTGQVLKSIQIVYTGEQWSYASGNVQSNLVSYKINDVDLAEPVLTGSGFTQIPELTFSSPIYVAGTTATNIINGNLAENKVVGITATINVTIPVGGFFWLKWYDFNDAGVDHQLSTDDLSITASYLGTSQNYITSKLLLSCNQGNLSISDGKEIENVVIYNTLGGVMLSRQVNATMADIAVGHLADGIYLAQVCMKDGNKIVKRFIK